MAFGGGFATGRKSGVVSTKKSTASKARPELSQELVIDSDDESEGDDLSKSAPATTVARKIPVSAKKPAKPASSDGDEESDSSREQQSPAQLNESNDEASEEEEIREDSDEDEENSSDEDAAVASNSGAEKNSAVPQINGNKRKTASQEEVESNERVTKKSRVEKQSDTQAVPSQTSQTAATPASIAVKEYQAPDGYARLSTASATLPIPSTFKDSTTFHISLSADVPMDILQHIKTDTIRAGELTYNKTRYVVAETAEEISVLLPTDSGYKRASKSMIKSYIVRPAFTPPSIPAIAAARDAGSSTAANIATAAVTSIRPQPRGLRMRFKPPGFGSGDPGIIGDGSDDEANAAGSIFQFPRAVGLSTDGDGTRLGDGTAKKKHKKQKSLSHAPNGIHTDAAPKPMSNEASALGDSDALEAARRKAEKRAKKAAKRKSLETA